METKKRDAHRTITQKSKIIIRLLHIILFKTQSGRSEIYLVPPKYTGPKMEVRMLLSNQICSFDWRVFGDQNILWCQENGGDVDPPISQIIILVITINNILITSFNFTSNLSTYLAPLSQKTRQGCKRLCNEGDKKSGGQRMLW